jgi:hypothetical protein
LLTPVAYTAEPHQRKRGPVGYANYEECKPWLRDECTFRCVYCPERELCYPDRAASFSAGHIQPQKEAPLVACAYVNLVDACTRCNSFKRCIRLIDPTAVAFGKHVGVDPSGRVRALKVDGQASRDRELIIRLLHLNEDPALRVRRFYLDNLDLKRQFPTNEKVDSRFRQSFGYPPLEDLPDLTALRPPAGNSLADNLKACYHARRQQSSLADVY